MYIYNIRNIQYLILYIVWCILYLVYILAPHRWARPAHRVRWHHESIPLTVNSFYLQMSTKLSLKISFNCKSEVFTLIVAICLHPYMYWFYLFVFSPLCIFNVFSQVMHERIHNHTGCISLTFLNTNWAKTSSRYLSLSPCQIC